MDKLKQIPWQVWAVGGAALLAVYILNNLPNIAKGATTAVEQTVSTLGNDVVTAAGNTFESTLYIVTGGHYGTLPPVTPTAAS